MLPRREPPPVEHVLRRGEPVGCLSVRIAGGDRLEGLLAEPVEVLQEPLEFDAAAEWSVAGDDDDGVVGDQLLKGAALNAVQIAELLA